MIKYALICDKQHEFEGWFSNGHDFDAQKKRGLVNCPFCESSKIEKALMAPSVSTSKSKKGAVVPSQPNTAIAANPEVEKQFKELTAQIRKFRDDVETNSENVGDKFSEEARKIHYGEAEKRGIYGQASAKDVKSLVEEGVEVLPLPELPEDKN